MQMQAGEIEPDPPKPTLHLESYYEWAIRIFVLAYIGGMCWALLKDEQLRIHVLHKTIKVLHFVATAIGVWALQAEQAYNDTVSNLH